MTDSIAENLRRVQDRIANAAIAAGRKPRTSRWSRCRRPSRPRPSPPRWPPARRCSARTASRKPPPSFRRCGRTYPLSLHIIGGLQTNKARDAVRIADVIESLDRPKLADAIAAAIAREGRTPTLLIEVNTGSEPQKSGIARDDADGFIDECKDRFGSALAGLMCVPPHDEDPRPHFTWLADRAARHGLTTVSMGMSADFEIAIACGATWVRVGSAIFGSR